MAFAPPRLKTPPPRPPRGSFASPSIAPKSAHARRMSLSSTPQHAVLLPPSTLSTPLRHPQFTLSAILATVMLLGIMTSLIFGTSLNTSLPHHHLPERLHFFARKSNPINQVFVKNAWGWTSLAYLLHLASSPPARTSRRSRLAVWLLATTFWLIFTTWFFGAGLGDRLIALSGGSCTVALPKEWNLDPVKLRPLLPSGFPGIMSTDTDADQLYLPLPHGFCSLRTPLTPKTHPDLFGLLSSESTVFPSDPNINTLSPTSSHPTLTLPNPRWHKGFDISGHAFLLTLSTLVLARELTPSWRGERSGSVGRAGGWGKWVHVLATWGGTALVGLWVWMVGMTGVWFHNPPEKLSGLVLGLGAGALINLLIPQSTPSKTFASRTQAVLAGVTGEDENAARRGQVVDEGIIVEEEEGRADEFGRKATGKRKVE